MPEYGLTPTGPNIKRLEDIRDEMHKDLTEKWGVNTRQNEESFLNHLITNIADQLAQAWEFGEEVYFAMYPSSAEGVSLDNAAQFGGSTRELPEKSYYPILCTGIDGTIIPSRTIIASDTNPAINLVLMEERRITREAFNKAEVILAADHMTGSMGIALNGTLYTKDVQPELGVKANLEALAAEIKDEDFNISVTDDAIVIESKDETLSHVMVLSENLTTRTVGSVITFATEDYGDIKIPNGIITNIVRSVVGLASVVNVGKCEYPVRVLLCESGSGGQIKAEFTLRRVIACPKSMFQRLTDEACSAAKCACLTVREVLDYLGDADTAYLWEVSDLVDYCSTKGRHVLNIRDFGLKRAPQSWQYVEEV